jgi:hypothetical protein
MSENPNFRETDSTHPNPPINTPSPLLNQAQRAFGIDNVFRMPWPRKPIGKPGRPPAKRSGVQRLGMKHRKFTS